MRRNTGQQKLEQDKLEFLREHGVGFSAQEIVRTGVCWQVPTDRSDRDLATLNKLVQPIGGEVFPKHERCWIKFPNEKAYPLWQRGSFFVLFGLSYYVFTYYSEDIFKFVLQSIF